MNQILDYNPNKSSGSGSSSNSDKVVRILVVILIIFAACLIGSGIYGMFKNNQRSNVSQADTPTKAIITVERDENDDTKAIIKVRHDKAIEKVAYTWDNGKDIINKGSGQPTMEIEINLPAGTHTLTVKVTDIDGESTIYDEEIYSENGEDRVDPEIKTTVDQATKKIVITATDETELDYLTYRWNDEEEHRVDADPENPKEIKVEIEIPKGTNDLIITAIDKNNNTGIKQDKYTGVTKPEITIIVSEDKKSIHVDVSHENGLKEVTLSVNGGNPMPLEMGEETRTEVGFDYDGFTETNNTIVVKAVSVDGTETEATEEISIDEPEELPGEDNIEIILEKYEDIADKVYIDIKTESPLTDLFIDINGEGFSANVAGLREARIDDIQLGDGVTKFIVTVKTEDGAEKTVEQEFTIG